MYKSKCQNKNVRSLLQKSLSWNLLDLKRKSIVAFSILVLLNKPKDFCPWVRPYTQFENHQILKYYYQFLNTIKKG